LGNRASVSVDHLAYGRGQTGVIRIQDAIAIKVAVADIASSVAVCVGLVGVRVKPTVVVDVE
jgi:hypothetical protein